MSKRWIAGWGNYPRMECDVRVPWTADDVRRSVCREGTIARGLGRSYGDPALNDRGAVIDATRLDRYVDFDQQHGLLTCEAGVSLGQIIADFAPRGYFPLVTPGTKHVTIGGGIANDVHGKAHHVDGCFSSSVEAFTILLASGDVVAASREENNDLFWANFGGMGLLGIILEATIRLRRIETTYFRQKAVVVNHLEELLGAFEQYDARYPYSVAWIDPLAMGDQLGRGVLTVGDHACLAELPASHRHQPLRVSTPAAIKVPISLPNFSLNPLTLRLLNLVIGQVQARGAALAHYEKFFYPLDAIDAWNRGYGSRGFAQYQFVVPLDEGYRRIRPIMERIAGSGLLPFLNVLKRLGKERGLLSFPMEGYTFAIDFPIQQGLQQLLHELDRMVVDAGGRVYLGKDAFVRPDTFSAMYPRLDEWRQIKAKYDSRGIFTSNLSRRVGLTAG